MIWLDPSLIRYRVSPISDLSGTADGDWDRDRLYLLTETVKYRAIRDHLRDGVPWEQTELFPDITRGG